MKNCSYCGKEYGDNVDVCPLDDNPVVSRVPRNEPKGTWTFPPATRSYFNVKMISPITSSGDYRIFIERSDLIFIQLENSTKSLLDVIAPFLGAFGALIPLASWLLKKRKKKTDLKRIEEANPEDLLRDSDRNFKLYFSEIREASFEPPAFLSVGGKIGRLKLLVRHGEKFRFEFTNDVEMKNAIQLLTPLLFSTLKMNVEWNEQNHRFEKKQLTR